MRGYRFSCTRQELTRQALRRECQSPLSTHQGPAAVPPPPLVARPARRRSLGSSAADIGVVEVTLCLPERKRAEAALYWDTELHVDEGQISTRGGKMHRHTCSAVRCTGTPVMQQDAQAHLQRGKMHRHTWSAASKSRRCTGRSALACTVASLVPTSRRGAIAASWQRARMSLPLYLSVAAASQRLSAPASTPAKLVSCRCG